MVVVWDYNPKTMPRRGRDYTIWKLTRQINYGLKKGEKIRALELKRFWRFIKADPGKKAALKALLWPKKQS